MAIEHKSIDYVTEHERHGRVIDQAPFWFLGNFHFFTIAIGFVGPSMGLSFGYTSLAGALGILFGTLFVAFHASQGAELGLPQMIQSRAQFGYRGVVIVLVGTLFTFIGFNVADSVLVARGVHGMLGWNETAVTLIAAGIATAIAVYGHDWLHRIFRWCFWACLPLYTLLTLAIATGQVPATHFTAGGFTWTAFIAQFAASAAYNITYAPSVSDYSRYLPRDTRPSHIIAAVFLGATTAAIWLICLGAWLASRIGASDGLVALHDAGSALFAGFGVAMALASVTALVATMGLNAYSGMLTVVTALNSLFAARPSPRLRIAAIIFVAACWIGGTFAITTNAIALLFATLTIMLYLLVPWTSVNLVDYFVVRRGRYAITDLFDPRGIYGSWSVRGLAAYLLGFIATLPFFVVPDFYTGPVARALGGVDVGWLVGLVASGGIYWLLCRSLDLSREEEAIRASDAALQRRHQPEVR
ncbi:MAG TPA: cytosine permease [Steroidobacteraceae bacterium]|nr:cytosine permease [Steroidobacteraceae bacterium]